MKQYKLVWRADDYQTYLKGITDILDALGFSYDHELDQVADHADVYITLSIQQRKQTPPMTSAQDEQLKRRSDAAFANRVSKEVADEN